MNARTSDPSPGARLRNAREAMGLTIEVVAERLRLNAALVLAMEEERIALLGRSEERRVGKECRL